MQYTTQPMLVTIALFEGNSSHFIVLVSLQGTLIVRPKWGKPSASINLFSKKPDTENHGSDSDSEDLESDEEQIEILNNNESNISVPTNHLNSSSNHAIKTAHLNSSKVALFSKRKVEAVKTTKRSKRKENDRDENGRMMSKVMAMTLYQRQSNKDKMKAEMLLRREERMEEVKLRRLEFKQQQQHRKMRPVFFDDGKVSGA